MIALHVARTVFVPFEVFADGTEKKCDDLPRFLNPSEVKAYIGRHPWVGRRLQWREHHEKEFLEEYLAGVGTPRFRKL